MGDVRRGRSALEGDASSGAPTPGFWRPGRHQARPGLADRRGVPGPLHAAAKGQAQAPRLTRGGGSWVPPHHRFPKLRLMPLPGVPGLADRFFPPAPSEGPFGASVLVPALATAETGHAGAEPFVMQTEREPAALAGWAVKGADDGFTGSRRENMNARGLRVRHGGLSSQGQRGLGEARSRERQ